jgi:predicted metal-dependent hydrolase
MPGRPAADGQGHRYVIRRSRRARRSRLTIDRDGVVTVVLPLRVPSHEAERLVQRHDAWIGRHLDRLAAQRARLAARPGLHEGRVLEVHGRPLIVVVQDAAWATPQVRGSVKRRGDRLVVQPGADGRGPAILLEGWLRTLARRVISTNVDARAAEMGVRPVRIEIRDQVSRWASASARGTLSFSWRLVLAPPEVLDAVVVHELAHLRLRGHSRAFWDLAEHYAPATAASRAWLREHAAEMRAALE